MVCTGLMTCLELVYKFKYYAGGTKMDPFCISRCKLRCVQSSSEMAQNNMMSPEGLPSAGLLDVLILDGIHS